jgi:TPR repeat protein
MVRAFGKRNVFMDVDRMLAGRFDRVLETALAQCEVLVAIIGPRWMETLSEHTRAGDRDFVRDEIAAALRRDIIVIPVLVGRQGAMPSLPRKQDLPDEISDLILYQKHDIAHESAGRDADHLADAIKSVLNDGRGSRPWKSIGFAVAVGLVLALTLLGYKTDWSFGGGIGGSGSPRVAEGTVFAGRTSSDADRAAAEAASKKAVDDETKRKADAEANLKAAQEATKKKTDEAAAAKKAADQESVRKVAEEVANKKAVADCDRLAASPYDTSRPSGVSGVYFDKIDAPAATTACEDALWRYPDVARLIFQAGRAADARKNYARALELYRSAVAKGNVAAMVGLGDLSYQGDGVAQDYAEARRWFEKGAAAGDGYAAYSVGDLYENGYGVEKDYFQARSWYEKGAALGDASAMTNLGTLYSRGQGVAQDHAQARKWYEKAAALGRSTAMYNLGNVYAFGHGVRKDAAQARAWYQKALDAGDPNAGEALKKLK